MGYNLENSPNAGEWWHVIHLNHANYYFVQIAIAFTRGDATMYKRVCRNSQWEPWMFFSPGTATAAQVLKGYTFSSAAGSNLTGTYDPGDNYNNGYNAGYSAGNSNGYTNGYNAGKNDGYNSANKVKWSSGQIGTTGPFSTSWSDGKTANTLYLSISGLGFTPFLVAAYCTSNSAHWSIRYGNTCISAGSGTTTCTNISNFAFNSSSCQIPTHRTTSTTWNWYACGYY